MKTTGYAVQSKGAPLTPWTFERRELRAGDVAMEVLYCGVCHSDLHQVRDDWGGSIFPMVPGHEIIGRVTAVAPGVTRFKVGDAVAVGCMVDSCQHCRPCRLGEEQYCTEGMTATYNGRDRVTDEPTQGGLDGSLVLVGQIGPMGQPSTVPLVMGRRRLAGSLIGGIAETQELLDFCARKGVLPDVEIIPIDRINEAWERMERADVRYRFVIDMASLPAAA